MRHKPGPFGRLFTCFMLLLSAASFAQVAPVAPQKDDLPTYVTDAEKSLNTVKSLAATFLQLNPSGEALQGKIYILRPGYMRLEYAKGSQRKSAPALRIVADGQNIIHYDTKLKEKTHFSLEGTPASLLLRSHLKFSGDLRVAHHERKNGLIFIELMRHAHPDEGSLTLVFIERSLHLHQWIVTDPHGQKTTVTLMDTMNNITIDSRLFDVLYEDPKRVVETSFLGENQKP